MMRPDPRWLFPLCAALTACQSPQPDDFSDVSPEIDEPSDGPPVERSAVTPPPVSGGTLLVMNDGDLAVAADPDRDLVHVVDLANAEQLHAIELRAGDEPGRLVADASGRVHVLTRRGGAVVDLDPLAGTIEGRRALCPNPRGIAYDAEADLLHVACAGGDVVSLPAAGGAPTRRIHLGPDLRDVLVTPEGLVVTSFRSAHVMRLDHEGTLVDDQGLPIRRRRMGFEGRVTDVLTPNTAWRTVSTPEGGWLMVHQTATERALPIGPPEESDSPDSGYGGGGGDDGCGGAVQSVLSMSEEAFSSNGSPLLRDVVLPVDVAIDPRGGRIAIAAAGHQNFAERSGNNGVFFVSADTFTSDTEPGCEPPPTVPVTPGQYTAVAFDPSGRILAQSREPAFVTRLDPDDPDRPLRIDLEGPLRADTGHDLFHLDAGAGIACASCHPEGGDDGHVWTFVGVGSRHTPALTFGLEGTAPFHWEGDLADMRELVDDVHVTRMGGTPLDDAWVGALEHYLFSLPSPTPTRTTEDPAVQRGAALFSSWGCRTCHAGATFTSPDSVSMGFDIDLQVPGLRGVALHPPYMHDGRARDLQAAVSDMLERTRPDTVATAAEMTDILAYLASL